MQARWGTHGDHPIIALYPRGVRETYDLTVRAFNLSETYRTPVVLLLDETIGHVSEKVVLPSKVQVVEREDPNSLPQPYLPYAQTETDVPPMVSFGQGYRFHVTGLVHDHTGFPTNEPAKIDEFLRRLDRKITRYSDHIIQVEQQFEEEAEVGVIAYGSPARSAKHAVKLARAEGIAASFLALLTMWPFPAKQVKSMGEQVSNIVVPELNLGQIAHEVEWAVEGKSRVHRLSRIDGEPISPQQILERIREVTAK